MLHGMTRSPWLFYKLATKVARPASWWGLSTDWAPHLVHSSRITKTLHRRPSSGIAHTNRGRKALQKSPCGGGSFVPGWKGSLYTKTQLNRYSPCQGSEHLNITSDSKSQNSASSRGTHSNNKYCTNNAGAADWEGKRNNSLTLADRFPLAPTYFLSHL